MENTNQTQQTKQTQNEELHYNSFIEERYNLEGTTADELLSGAQGDDDDVVDSFKKGEEEKGGEGGEGGEGDEGGGKDGDDDKGRSSGDSSSLTEEEYNKISSELDETFNRFGNEEDAEAQEIKKDLLSLFEGGESFDDEGNVLDKEGNILASFEDLVNKVGETPETLYDDKGNEINEKGEIVRTKRQIDVDNNEINKVAKNLGYQFKDETGQIKLYKEGDEGLNELALDIANYNTQVAQQEFFDSNPVLREVAKHLLSGGSLEDFKEPVDYSKVDVKKLSFENKLNYIKQSFIAEGVNPERAEKLVKGMEDDEKTTKEALEALDILKTKEEEQEQLRTQRIQQQEQQEAENNRKYWEGVKSTITKGKLADLEIPESDREAFFKYMAIPVKDGKSQEMLDMETMNEEQFLKEKYYRFKKYDVSNIVKDNVNRNRVKSIRDRIKAKQEISTGRKPNIKGGTGEVSLDNIVD